MSADPPSRAARLGYAAGAVSFSPAGESDWVQAAINRPLTTGDRLWADADARAEIQVGGAMIRMDAGTGLSVLDLDDRMVQLQLTQGTLDVRVRRLEANQVFEVDTPNLAFTLRQAGAFRIEVDPEGDATTIVVRKGQGEAYGEDAAYVIDSRQSYRFTGTGLREYQYLEAPRLDEFDRWSDDRDRSYDNSRSARYVSQDVIGYQDLDANGTWSVDATYGNVWYPNRVDEGWAPYRDGHWTWIDPWGWTWVDDAPWGFAVSHYGRWTNQRGRWGWVPGPPRTRAYYAPALVAFVGGDNFQLTISSGSVGAVAWFPLAPREVYRPSYAVSRGYFDNVNRSNTVINNTVINNYYSNPNATHAAYANRRVPGAVVAVPTTAFVQSQPVSRAAVRVSESLIVNRPVVVVPSVAPTQRSVHGAATRGGKPPARVFERPVVARTAPPAAHVGFAAQQQQLAAKPGKPLDDAARRQLKPSPAAPAPIVRVITQTQKPAANLRPPPKAPGTKPAPVARQPAERAKPEPAPVARKPAETCQARARSRRTPTGRTRQARTRSRSTQAGRARQTRARSCRTQAGRACQARARSRRAQARKACQPGPLPSHASRRACQARARSRRTQAGRARQARARACVGSQRGQRQGRGTACERRAEPRGRRRTHREDPRRGDAPSRRRGAGHGQVRPGQSLARRRHRRGVGRHHRSLRRTADRAPLRCGGASTSRSRRRAHGAAVCAIEQTPRAFARSLDLSPRSPK